MNLFFAILPTFDPDILPSGFIPKLRELVLGIVPKVGEISRFNFPEAVFLDQFYPFSILLPNVGSLRIPVEMHQLGVWTAPNILYVPNLGPRLLFVIAPPPPYLGSLHFPHHFGIPKTKASFVLRCTYLFQTD